MAEGTIVFDRVWKKFRRGERHKSLRDLLPALVSRTVRRGTALGDEEFWALRNVSFEVRPGEALGIIGANGAGKSTALKLLSKIFRTTAGRYMVKGRVGSLIEVAAGFHPDLTGRENVYLQGAILGMKRTEIARAFDQIVEFAGAGDFVDTPVKRYSSGMNARLGFSIAAHLNPDVLLIDEILAVGDMAFQERCFDRLQLFRQSGAAIAFVSHNLKAISSLCDRVLVLSRGEVHAYGPTDEAIAAYAELLRRDGGTTTGIGESRVEVLDGTGRATQRIAAGSRMTVRAVVAPPRGDAALVCAMRIRRLDSGEAVFFTTSSSVGCPPVAVEPPMAVEVVWDLEANLARGHYAIELIFRNRNAAYGREALMRLNPAALFEINETQTEQGVVYLNPRCRATALDGAVEAVS